MSESVNALHLPASRRMGFPKRVEERSPVYENEGSERRSLGAVSITADGWWAASLTVPAQPAEAEREVAFLRVERRGAPFASLPGDASAELALPCAELDAFLVLCTGLVDQARRDGVLPR